VTGSSPLRLLYSSGGRWEDAFGSSRAIRIGDRIIVSGCTAVVDGVVRHPGDAGAQMAQALDQVFEAVKALGGTLGDVIATRVYVVSRADCDPVGRVHGERFADVRPVATMIVVAGLLDEQMLVEVEVEARVRSAKPYLHRGEPL
jgi:enamine deaminase RidA (YjgF/YER057c/UK114 family)